jgi:uncharacterized RDD family membrane protein YckC
MPPTEAQTLPARSIRMYVLAADADRAVCEAIVKHLKPVVRDFTVPVRIQHDFDVRAGSDVEAHKKQLLEADIVLALISADFISDDEVYSRVQTATALHNSGKLVMIPLLVRNCLWKATPFARLGMLPKNFQPLNNLQFWPSTDDALMAVVADVYGALVVLSLSAAATAEQPGPSAAGTSGSAPAPAAAAAAMPASAPVAAAAPVAVAPGATPLAATTADAPAAAAMPEAGVDWRRAYYRAVLWKRAGALAIDWVVAIALWFAWLIIYYSVFDGMSTDPDWTDVAVLFVIFYIFCPLLEASPWQATVGKRMLGLQITDRDGRRIGFGRAFVRTVLRSVVMYAYLFVIPAVVQLLRFPKTKKLFHDELSSTLIGERVRPQQAPTAAAMATA